MSKHKTLSELFAIAARKHGGQQLLAKRCGISQPIISQYISGSVLSVKSKNVAKIAKCLGVPVLTLLAACERAPKLRRAILRVGASKCPE